jgi:hypothetical protein
MKGRRIMCVPSELHPCWTKLAAGELARLRTEQLGLQLLAKRLDRSDQPMPKKAAEIRAYFVKYERILGTEISQLG